MKTYRIEQYLKNVKSIDKSARRLFKKLNLKYENIISSGTRYAYDDSDYTGWVLFYGEEKRKEMKEDIILLLDMKIKEKTIFSVSGNGFGTGLLIGSNLSTNYDKE